MKALLIRHGETDWNKSGKFLGQYDVPLNDRGLAQARETAEAVAADGPDALYSSPLARTMRLAEEVSRLTALPVNPMPGLKELDLGDMEGLTGAELRERWPDFFSEWRKDPGPVLMPGGESLAQLQDRAWSAFEEIEALHRGMRGWWLCPITLQSVPSSAGSWGFPGPTSTTWRLPCVHQHHRVQ